MAAPVPVAAEQVAKATRALLAHEKRREAAARGDKDALFQSGLPIFITIGLKTVPQRKIRKAHKIALRHPLYAESESGACLIVKDTVKQDTKALLEKHGISGISKVLTVEKLRKNYREYEAKRQLSAAYDLFLADNRVLPLLPKLLGKHFFVKKKHPVPVEMRKGDLKRQLESALRCTYLHVSGQSIAVKVGHTAMSEGEVCENVLAALGDIGGAVPGKWPAIQTLHLKSAESAALPLYNSLPDGAVAADKPTEPKPGREAEAKASAAGKGKRAREASTRGAQPAAKKRSSKAT